MSEKKKVEEADEPGAPLYMLSFSDMMTNLLCFFILLEAFADERRAGFISDGVSSFREALMSHGLPGVLKSDQKPMDLGADRVLFRPAKSINSKLLVDESGRITDANRDALREVVMDTLEKPGTNEIGAPLVFSPGSSTLTTAHRAVLDTMAPWLTGYSDIRIRVEGFAWKEGLGTEAAWHLAMQRADNVIRYLSSAGDIPIERFIPIGYGPTGGGETSWRQDSWGRRIALISTVGP
ncbi:MAG: hypothetical protein CMJ83_02810 [Planctomycetes bacterium]|nr:hypothetical protein [Planctomycetota bacterium]